MKQMIGLIYKFKNILIHKKDSKILFIILLLLFFILLFAVENLMKITLVP